MTLKTVNVVGTIYNADGSPAENMEGYFALNKFEEDTGVIVPTSTYFKTDADGAFSVNVWPNGRGSGESRYIVRAYIDQAVLLNTEAFIPDTDVVVDFNDVIIEPPYPPVDQALQILLDIQALSIQVKADGAEAIEAAQNALVSAQEAYDSQLLAKAWAAKTDGMVDGQEYSSKHYSQQSMAFRDESQDASETSIQHAIESATSARDAEDSATLSRDWAVKLDEPVDGIEYSAKYHANRAGASNQLAVDKAEEARISAQMALTSEQAAKTSETNAASSEQNAAISAGLAEVSSDLSKDWAIKVDGPVAGDEYSSKFHAERSKVSSDASKDSEEKAEISKTKSQQWASNPENIPVEGDLYSALHYASKANVSATIASQKADEASLSESNANDSRLAAKQSEDNAKESELAAKISEENALLSANQFDVNFTQMATAIINTQTIVVNHHGFGD